MGILLDEGRQRETALLREADSLRRLAFVAVFIAVILSAIGICAVPMVYSYLQRVQSELQIEADYCKSATGTLWQQFGRGHFLLRREAAGMSVATLEEAIRIRNVRQVGYEVPAEAASPAVSAPAPNTGGGVRPNAAPAPTGAGYGGAAGAPAGGAAGRPSAGGAAPQNAPTAGRGGEVCACSYGPAGPPGEPGQEGKPGADGAPGGNGQPGQDATPEQVPKAEDFCFTCEPSPPGPAGKPGPKGPPGNAGSSGDVGQPGTPGAAGQPGPQGPRGSAGPAGESGTPGQAGTLEEVNVPAGPPGPRGPPGQPGSAGENGQPGQPGAPGAAGPPGNPGPSGVPGKAGEPGPEGTAGPKGGEGACDHCPPPRTAPGY